MTRILLSSFLHTIEQISLFVLPGILGLGLNHVSGRLEIIARRTIGERPYTLLFGWLGTSVHELSHALMCVVFRHRVEKIKLFSLHPNTQKVGYVAHRYNARSLYQRIGNFFIGVAPIIMGALAIYLSAWLIYPAIISDIGVPGPTARSLPSILNHAFFSLLYALLDPHNYIVPRFYLFLYVLFCIGSSMNLSKADLKGACDGFISLILFVFLLNIIFNILASFRGDAIPGYPISFVKSAFFLYDILLVAMLMNLILVGAFILLKKLLKSPARGI